MFMYSSFIQTSLQNAAKIANDHFGKVTGLLKDGDPNQVLTQADLDIGKYIIGELKKTFPDHNIVDEEAGVIDNGSEFTWVIDPIDGTSNFAGGVPTYAVMLGLLKGKTPFAAGIAFPAFDQLYFGEKGSGVFLNDKKIKVSNHGKKMIDYLVAYGMDGDQKHPENTRKEAEIFGLLALHSRNMRSSNCVFDISMFLQGGYGAVLNQHSKIWDNVAQQFIVEEAGGVYTELWGQPIDYSDPFDTEKNYTFCVASPEIHKEVQELLKTMK